MGGIKSSMMGKRAIPRVKTLVIGSQPMEPLSTNSVLTCEKKTRLIPILEPEFQWKNGAKRVIPRD